MRVAMIFDENVFYDAVVVTNKVDPNMRGGVQARIIGYTDEIDDESQPFVYPELNCAAAVPEKGYYLRVKFEHGNVMSGRYVAVSQTKSGFYPDEYSATTSYPNVSVYNMGGDGYVKTYDRAKQVTQIDCPNGAHATWDGDGNIIITSDKAYEHAGDGARQEAGKAEHNVLTEATIDIFTCMPVGAGTLHQGSEYLTIPHVSARTIKSYSSPSADPSTDDAVPMVVGDPSAITLPINNANGEKVDEVELSLTKNYISRVDKKIDKIIIGVSNVKSFPAMAEEFMKPGSQSSAHYLIGRIDGDPEIASETVNKTLTNSGFLQFIQLDQDAYYAGGVYDSTGECANKNAVSIVLIASENKLSSISGYTQFQKDTVKELIVHIRTTAKDDTIPVVLASTLSGVPKLPAITEKFE